MSKLMSIMALGCFVFGLTISSAFAAVKSGFVVGTNGVVYEQPKCSEGETWSEEKQACEKKAE